MDVRMYHGLVVITKKGWLEFHATFEEKRKIIDVWSFHSSAFFLTAFH